MGSGSIYGLTKVRCHRARLRCGEALQQSWQGMRALDRMWAPRWSARPCDTASASRDARFRPWALLRLQAALNQMARNFTCEWAKDGVRAISVAPW